MRNNSEQRGSHTFTIRVYNTYYFSTAAMVTRTRPNVTFLHTSPALLYARLQRSRKPKLCLCQLDLARRASRYQAAVHISKRNLTLHMHTGISFTCQGQDSKIPSNKSKKSNVKYWCPVITLRYYVKQDLNLPNTDIACPSDRAV
jgi:hypothetical protein